MGRGRRQRQHHRLKREVTASTISAPQPLADHHQLAHFHCGEPSLDDWLKRRAAKNQANGSSRTYVVCEGEAVIGYYCLAAGAIGHAEAPPTMKRNRPDPVPVLLLGRLAIRQSHHQKGIGTALLNDGIRRALQAAEIAGVTALLVHAISEQARRFYLSRGFIESPVKPMTLCLMLATVDQALREPS
jgi:GNAT superfamily N-acetyltransferase